VSALLVEQQPGSALVLKPVPLFPQALNSKSSSMSKVSSDVLKEGIAGEFVQPATARSSAAAATALRSYQAA
jgi:hypothetical protein